MGREARAERHRDVGSPDRAFDGSGDVTVARKAQATTLGVAHTQTLHHGRGRRPIGSGFQGGVVLSSRRSSSQDRRCLTRAAYLSTTVSGSSFLPVGPIWISVPIVGQTPQS